MTNLHHHCGLGSQQAFDFGLQQLLFGLGVTHVRSVFVSSLRSARSQLAGALALTIALLLHDAGLASRARRVWDCDRIIRFNQPGAGGEQLLLLPRRRQQRPAVQIFAARRSRWDSIAWSYIGAEQTASGYQVALRMPGADQYTVWNTDSNGNYRFQRDRRRRRLGFELRAQIA